MNFTIPILIDKIVDFNLPVSLYKDNNFELLLSEFPISDREILFSLKNLQVGDKNAKYAINEPSSGIHTRFPEFIYSSYRILVQTQIDSEQAINLFNKISASLNFCCQLYFEHPITLKFFGDDNMCKSEESIQTFKRKSIRPIVNLETIDSFKITLLHCIKNDTVNAKKRSVLLSLLNITNLETFNSGLACSTFITILESLFTDEDTEITYRFSLRITKYLNESYSFFKTFKKLYGKRSVYYHKGERNFSYEDEVFLSKLTRQIIIEYIQCPSRFEISRLDEQLLL
jgi:hypothetical protein